MNDLSIPRIVNDLDVANAPLPVRYEETKRALAECNRIDECKDWGDKMAALASYARQRNDDELVDMAVRIHARAVLRCGELLGSFNKGVGRPAENRGGYSPISQREAADRAGLSKDQEKQARRVANVPADEFEMMVEDGKPATITSLAERGKKARPVTPGIENRPPTGTESDLLLGTLGTLVKKIDGKDPEAMANVAMDTQLKNVDALITQALDWLAEYHQAIKERIEIEVPVDSRHSSPDKVNHNTVLGLIDTRDGEPDGQKPKRILGKRWKEESVPDEWKAWCRENCPGLDVAITEECFCGHWLAAAVATATKIDWRRAWMNWCREQVRRDERFKPAGHSFDFNKLRI